MSEYMQKCLNMNCNIYVLFSLPISRRISLSRSARDLFGHCIFYGVAGQTISNTIQSTFDMGVLLAISTNISTDPVGTVVRTHFDTVLQLQSQIHQGTSVRERNWLRKNHAGW